MHDIQTPVRGPQFVDMIRGRARQALASGALGRLPHEIQAWSDNAQGELLGEGWQQRVAEAWGRRGRVLCSDCRGDGYFMLEDGSSRWCEACRGYRWVLGGPDAPCPACDGAQVVASGRPFGHPEFGRAVPCRSCTGPESQYLHTLARAGVPPRYRAWTLQGWRAHPAQEGKEDALAAVDALLRGTLDPERRGLLLTGQVGAGKSGLAVAIMRETLRASGGLSKRYRWVNWGTYIEALNEMRDTGASWRQDVRDASLADVLVIDDLAAERARTGKGLSDFGEAVLKSILDDRRDGSVLIVTAMWGGEDLAGRIGEHNNSRIRGLCVPVTVAGRDWRLGGAVERAA